MRMRRACSSIFFLVPFATSVSCVDGIDPPPVTLEKAAELLLGAGPPRNIVVDEDRSRAYVGTGKRIRRLNLVDRDWMPLESPNGVLYGLDERDDFLAQIDPETGQIRRILAYPESSIVPPLNAGFVTGITCNPDTGTLFMIDIFALGRAATLFEFDPSTGERTQIGETGLGAGLGEVFSLARDPATGRLYTVDVMDRLWRINPNAATAALVSGADIGFANIQGLSFSPLDGKLYGLNPPLNGPVEVVTIDLESGLGTLVTELPLGYTGGGLAFKPDGTLWMVKLLGVTDDVMFTDSLVQIDYSTNPAAIPVDFPTLELSVVFGPQSLFQGIDSLTFAPQGGGDQTVLATSDIDALGLATDGGVMASAGSQVVGFDPDFSITPGGINPSGLNDFRQIVVDPATDQAYVREGLSGLVFEFEPGETGVNREIRYRPESSFYSIPRSPEAGLDPMTRRLFLAGDHQLHVVDLDTEESEEIDGVDDDTQGLIVDPVRRRLHVNMLLGVPGQGGPGCSSIRTFDLDTLEVVGEVCVGIQIFNMAFDATRNRIAANTRTEVPSFDLTVYFFDMDTGAREPFSILLKTAEDDTNAVDAHLAFDPMRNQLLIARPDSPPRVEFYELPS